MSIRYKVIGVNDDRDFCEHCGRQGLMRVVWIEDTETQEIKHFGTSCAASPVKGFGVDKEIKAAISNFKVREQALWSHANRLYRKRGGEYTGTAQTGWKVTNSALHADCIKTAKAEMRW